MQSGGVIDAPRLPPHWQEGQAQVVPSKTILAGLLLFAAVGAGCFGRTIPRPVDPHAPPTSCDGIPRFLQYQEELVKAGKSKGFMVLYFDGDGNPINTVFLDAVPNRVKYCMVYLVDTSQAPFAPFVLPVTPECATNLGAADNRKLIYY